MATRLSIFYEDRRGRLRSILLACSELRFTIDHVEVERANNGSASREEVQDLADIEGTEAERRADGAVALIMQIKGKRPIPELVTRLSEIEGVIRVATVDEDSLD